MEVINNHFYLFLETENLMYDVDIPLEVAEFKTRYDFGSRIIKFNSEETVTGIEDLLANEISYIKFFYSDAKNVEIVEYCLNQISQYFLIPARATRMPLPNHQLILITFYAPIVEEGAIEEILEAIKVSAIRVTTKETETDIENPEPKKIIEELDESFVGYDPSAQSDNAFELGVVEDD